MASIHVDNVDLGPETVKRSAGAVKGAYADLGVALGLEAAALIAMYAPVIDRSLVRFGLALVLLMYLPGYALAAALYVRRDQLSSLERHGLAAGMSLVITPLIGFWLNYTIWGITEKSMAVCVSAFVAGCLAVAWLRRRRTPADQRFSADLASPVVAVLGELWPANVAGAGRTATVMLLASLVLLAGTVVLVTAVPVQHEKYTEFYLYGKNSTADEYPLNFTPGETKPVIVGIANHEGQDMSYTLSVTLADANGTAPGPFYTEKIAVPDATTLEKPINLKPAGATGRVNMVFTLYVDSSPGQPYRVCNLWTDIAPAPGSRPSAVNITPEQYNSTLQGF